MSDKTTNISIRLDADLKNKAEELFSDLGLNMTTAVTMFLRQVIRRQAIPFEIARNSPNSETLAAMQEAKRLAKDTHIPGYTSVEELLKDLNA